MRFTGFAITHPLRTLAAWVLLVAAFAAVGLGVNDRLHRSTFEVPGTDSHRANQLATDHFGERNTLVVLLRGPRPVLREQGRRLVARLDADQDLTVLSPWTPGLGRALRPATDAALIIVRVDRSFEHVSRVIVPWMRSEVDRITEDPIAAYVSGFADVAAGAHEASISAIRRAELLAIPLLVLILLIVFRSPIAAALPLLMGVATIAAVTSVEVV